MTSGSGPPRRPVSSSSIAAISSPESSKSNTLTFSAMRVGLVDFGMTERPTEPGFALTMARQAPAKAGLAAGFARDAQIAITGTTRAVPASKPRSDRDGLTFVRSGPLLLARSEAGLPLSHARQGLHHPWRTTCEPHREPVRASHVLLRRL